MFFNTSHIHRVPETFRGADARYMMDDMKNDVESNALLAERLRTRRATIVKHQSIYSRDLQSAHEPPSAWTGVGRATAILRRREGVKHTAPMTAPRGVAKHTRALSGWTE